MYCLGDNDLAELVDERSRGVSVVSFWWYRDVILQAQERGLVKVIAHTEEKPFWWRSVEESIELSDKMKDLILKGRQR
jgi:hypothetical protein